MKMGYIIIFIILGCFATLSYSTDTPERDGAMVSENRLKNTFNQSIKNKADRIINESIEAHGGDLFKTASYLFTFRNRRYCFVNNEDQYKYYVEKNQTTDFLENGVFKRYVNKKLVDLPQKEITAYSNSLNSVIYFAILPHKLTDASVNKSYKGTTVIKQQNYNIIEVTFNESGGGNDHEDVFYYWINSETKTMDYLAYSYKVNGGGIRFRSAYNPREIDGIRFQDYINYEAPMKAQLISLPKLYEKGVLEEVSRIKTENVISLNK